MRAAASSIASGSPSSRAADLGNGRRGVAAREVGLHLSGAIDEELHGGRLVERADFEDRARPGAAAVSGW